MTGDSPQAAAAGESPPAPQAPEVPLDDEAKRLKLDQMKAESRKAIAEAQQAELTARLPSSDVKPLEGKTEIGEGVGLVADLLAHAVLDRAAGVIRTETQTYVDEDSWVLVVDDRELAGSDWAYSAVAGQLAQERAAIDAALEEVSESAEPPNGTGLESLTVGTALVAAPAMVGAAASLVGMFRSDYSIESRSVTIGSTPLAAAVTRHLLAAGVKVSVDGFNVLDSPLDELFLDTRAKRVELERAKAKLNAEAIAPSERVVEDLRADRAAAEAAYQKALGTDGADKLRERVERALQADPLTRA